MVELKGRIGPELVAERALALLADPDDLSRRRRRLAETMPRPGAARALVELVLERSGLGAPAALAAPDLVAEAS